MVLVVSTSVVLVVDTSVVFVVGSSVLPVVCFCWLPDSGSLHVNASHTAPAEMKTL